jgi:hypothetical protein
MTQVLNVPAPLVKPPGTSISYVDGGGSLRTIWFDATLMDDHQGTAVVTSRALDVNARVSTHVRADNRRFTLQAEVTNTPLITGDGAQEIVVQVQHARRELVQGASVRGGNGAFIPGAGTVQSPVSAEPATYQDAQTVHQVPVTQYPNGMDRAGEVVRVNSRLTDYQEMVIVGVGAPHGPADAIEFTVAFEEIRRASSEVIEVDPPVAEKRAEKTKPAGNQPKYEPTPEKQSAADAAVQGLADLWANR